MTATGVMLALALASPAANAKGCIETGSSAEVAGHCVGRRHRVLAGDVDALADPIEKKGLNYLRLTRLVGSPFGGSKSMCGSRSPAFAEPPIAVIFPKIGLDPHRNGSGGATTNMGTRLRSLSRWVALAVTLVFGGVAHAADRVALVIGNSAYKEVGALANPKFDATAISKTLTDLGFETTLALDTDETALRKAVRTFAYKSASASLAVVFYAGHGTQVNGENYLIPVDMGPPAMASDIELTGLKLDDLVNSIQSKTKIIFLDACRDNPMLIQNLVASSRGMAHRGLAPENAANLQSPNPGGGLFIAYATDSGSVAEDGQGQHSPFTQALLDHLSDKLSLDEMFGLVTKEVRSKTNDAQRPYKYASLEDVICLACTSSGKPSNVVAKSQPKSKPHDEWVLYGFHDKVLAYVKFDSIKVLPNNITAAMIKTVFGGPYNHPAAGPTPDGSYEIDEYVYDCSKPDEYRISETTVLSKTGSVLYHYKWSDPKFIAKMVAATKIAPGSMNATAITIVCNDSLRTPILEKGMILEQSFTSLSSTAQGDGDIYYRLDSDHNDANSKHATVIVRFRKPQNLKQLPNMGELPIEPVDYDTLANPILISCIEDKFAELKFEYYSSTGDLLYAFAPDPSKINWYDVKPHSSMKLLQDIACKSTETTQ